MSAIHVGFLRSRSRLRIAGGLLAFVLSVIVWGPGYGALLRYTDLPLNLLRITVYSLALVIWAGGLVFLVLVALSRSSSILARLVALGFLIPGAWVLPIRPAILLARVLSRAVPMGTVLTPRAVGVEELKHVVLGMHRLEVHKALADRLPRGYIGTAEYYEAREGGMMFFLYDSSHRLIEVRYGNGKMEDAGVILPKS